MQHKKFDGYLLNFEANTNRIELVIKWIKKLYTEMKKIN